MKKLFKANRLRIIAAVCGAASAVSFACSAMGRKMSALEAGVILGVITACMLAGGMCMASDDAEDGRSRHRSVHIAPDDCVLDRQGRKCVTLWHRKAVFLPFFPVRTVYRPVPAPEAYDAVRRAGVPVELQTEYVRERKFITVTDRYVKIWGPPER